MYFETYKLRAWSFQGYFQSWEFRKLLPNALFSIQLDLSSDGFRISQTGAANP